MPKIIIAIFATVIIGYVLFFHGAAPQKSEKPPISDMQKQSTKTASSTPAHPSDHFLPPPVGIVNTAIPGSYKLGRNLLAPSEKAQIALENSKVLPSDLAGEVYIAFNRNQIAQLRKNARFTIPIPQLDTEFDVVVNEIVTHPNGDRTVRATLTGTNEDYSVTITQGDEATYANIGTPDGVYVLEAQGENGWISSRTAMRGNHNFTVTDAVVPPVVTQPKPPVIPQVPSVNPGF